MHKTFYGQVKRSNSNENNGFAVTVTLILFRIVLLSLEVVKFQGFSRDFVFFRDFLGIFFKHAKQKLACFRDFLKTR